ncbi:MAG: MFS transporter [Pseudomonadota bacterium]|jgi:MFS family permease|nr:MFS transporter [Pseudomonadota bacterium]
MVKKRYAVVGLLSVVSVITFLDRMAIAVLGPRIQHDLGLTPEEWGWVLSAYVVAYGLFEIPSGALGDRHGQRRELSRIAAWWSAFTALTGVCTSFVPLAIVRFCFGMGSAGAYPNASGVLWRWLPGRERARGQGAVWAASRLGGALAPLLLVPLAAWVGWRPVFWVLAVIGAAWALTWWMWYHDRPAEQPGIRGEELREIGSGHGDAHGGRGALRRLLKLRQLWLIVLAYGCYGCGSWFYFNWFPTWMVHAGRFTMAQMGVFAAFPFLLGIGSNLIGGAVCDRLGLAIGLRNATRLMATSCLIIGAALLGAMSLVTSQTAIVVLATAGFATMDLMLPAAWAMCMSIGGSHGGAATGVMNTAGEVGGVLCTLAFGYIAEATGNYELPVRGIALMVLIAAFVFSRVDCTAGLADESSALDAPAPG